MEKHEERKFANKSEATKGKIQEMLPYLIAEN